MDGDCLGLDSGYSSSNRLMVRSRVWSRYMRRPKFRLANGVRYANDCTHGMRLHFLPDPP